MSSYSKALNQCRRLPREIVSLEGRGREEAARRAREELQRAKALVEARGGRTGGR